MFIATLCIITQNWKQPKYPPLGEWCIPTTNTTQRMAAAHHTANLEYNVLRKRKARFKRPHTEGARCCQLWAAGVLEGAARGGRKAAVS